MFRLLTDENFNDNIRRGILLRQSDLDIVRVQDTAIASADDPEVLEWAATAKRVILTHDRTTMPDFAYHRMAGGKPMAGVFLVPYRMPIGLAIDHLLMVIQCSEQSEWEGIVLVFPL